MNIYTNELTLRFSSPSFFAGAIFLFFCNAAFFSDVAFSQSNYANAGLVDQMYSREREIVV
jgi:hypothetical protein